MDPKKLKRLWIAAGREMVWLIALAVLAIAITGSAHAEAIGELRNVGHGTITAFDDLCDGKPAMWFKASTYSQSGGKIDGCWRVYDRDTMLVEWTVNGRKVSARYPFDSFVKPHTL